MKKVIAGTLAALSLTTAAVAGDPVDVFAKSSKLKFSGTHYLGYKNIQYSDDTKDSFSGFETRRNYLQVKAYLLEDPKSYLRVTLDTYQNKVDTAGTDVDIEGENSWNVRLKYAYLYLNEVLPFTGVELGQVHRPWIDYEEHQGWWYRSISKVYVEASESAHLTNSADLGFNFKTKTPYFTSEIGMFNGEGYHSEEGGTGNSLEWRATASMLGNGEKKRKPLKDNYFDASFFGQYNMDSTKNGEETYAIYGLHTVFNMPALLVAAQYVMADNDATTRQKDFNGQGLSVNGTYRFGADYKWEVLGRYDVWTAEDDLEATEANGDLNRMYGIVGAAYQYNKNVKFIANALYTDPNTDFDNDDYVSYMLTAEVHW